MFIETGVSLDFQIPTLEDASWAVPLLEASGRIGCEYSYTTMFMWRHFYHNRLARFGDHVFFSAGKDAQVFLPPMGPSLREGLDIPEVSLVAILDADKEGFLRSERSMIQTIGRAARNVNGKVIMYGDKITDSMAKAIGETNRRREKQMAFNEEHHIVPQTIQKEVRDVIAAVVPETTKKQKEGLLEDPQKLSRREREKLIASLEKEMKKQAAALNFEQAAEIRDAIIELQAAGRA